MEYIRDEIKTANVTSVLEEYIDINKLDDNHRFFKYNGDINKSENSVPSHNVIQKHIKKYGKDYRFETKQHPLESMQNRKKDNTSVGRLKQ